MDPQSVKLVSEIQLKGGTNSLNRVLCVKRFLLVFVFLLIFELKLF